MLRGFPAVFDSRPPPSLPLSMTSAQGSPSKAPSGAWRLAAWAGAVTAMLVSFVHEWTVPLLGENLRPQRGHLLLEAWMVVKWSVIGSLLGGWWWSAVERWRRSGTVIVLLWSAAGMAGALSREVFWAGLLVWLMPPPSHRYRYCRRWRRISWSPSSGSW